MINSVKCLPCISSYALCGVTGIVVIMEVQQHLRISKPTLALAVFFGLHVMSDMALLLHQADGVQNRRS